MPEYPSEERRRAFEDEHSFIDAPNNVCPRCQGPVPDTQHFGEYPGARSRTDNRTEVCSNCGRDEAFEQMAGRLTAKGDWPVERPYTPVPVAGWFNGWENERSSDRAARTPIPMPREVPDLRLHLLERWLPDGVYQNVVSMRGVSNGLKSAEVERKFLRQASLWWIRDEMVALTMAAAKSIPDDLYAEEVKLPAEMQYGMAVLGEPFVGMDSEKTDEEIKVDCIVWGRDEVDGIPCLSMSMYCYFDFGAGLRATDLRLAVQTGAIFDAKQEWVGNSSQPTAHLRGGSWVFLGRTDWPLTDRLDSFEGFPHMTEAMLLHPQRKKSMMEDRKFFSALCVLLSHKLSTTDMVWSDRQVRRRSERAGVNKREPSHVRLIRLREVRSSHHESDEERQQRHVEWTHRWIVNGHMAWRRCGHGRLQRRLVFVSPHVKGPADKPLVVKENVRVWTR